MDLYELSKPCVSHFLAKHRETNDRHRDEQLKRYVAQTLRGMPGWATTRAKI